MPLTREKLDHMAAHDYATGRLRVDPKAEPVVLLSCCHADAPAVCWLDPTGLVLILACSECLMPIADVALAARPKRPLTCPESGEDEVWASYRHATSKLRLECAGCGAKIAELAVTSDAN
jgi:hypothetical protein